MRSGLCATPGKSLAKSDQADFDRCETCHGIVRCSNNSERKTTTVRIVRKINAEKQQRGIHDPSSVRQQCSEATVAAHEFPGDRSDHGKSDCHLKAANMLDSARCGRRDIVQGPSRERETPIPARLKQSSERCLQRKRLHDAPHCVSVDHRLTIISPPRTPLRPQSNS